MTSIPMDLILDVLSRLPAKSITRFLCVSKLWGSMLHRPYFTELFLTRSLARPRLLFALKRGSEWSIFSSPQLQNPYGKSSLVVGACFHMKLSKDVKSHYINGSYASGLILFPHVWLELGSYFVERVIYNPNRRQYLILPRVFTGRTSDSYLGFDPIDKQFKVLSISYPPYDDHHILTLGTGKMRWRKIQCPLVHNGRYGKPICFNGVVFYLAKKFDDWSYVIVCFDVRSEKFTFIDAQHFGDSSYINLINYKGKLGGVRLNYADDGGFPLELCMWVLKDVEKHECSKYVYTLRADNEVVKVNRNLSVVGVTATGDIVLLKTMNSIINSIKPFYVFYFNPERNTLLSVEIQGFEETHGFGKLDDHRVYAFVDHVEDLTFNTMRTICAATFVSSPEQNRNS